MIEHISTTKKRVVAILGAALIGAAITSPVASAQTLTTLVSFDGISAAAPYSALIADTNGNLFGATAYGGSIFAQAARYSRSGKRPRAIPPLTCWSASTAPMAGVV
jgi:hypothetical protein